MADNDGEGCRACPNEASDFVCWTEEGPTKIMGVVEDGDPLCAARHEDDVERLIELSHFLLEFASKSIAPVKPAMFRLPDSFTVVSELTRAVQEVWKGIMGGFSLAL